MAPKKTKSEELFEELCEQQGIKCARLAEIPGHKQPDYELSVCGSDVVVEIKQIEPNEDDLRFAEAFARDGVASQCRNPDDVAERVRNHIKTSRSQFKSFFERQPARPAILVLFDNAKNGYTDSYTIQTAMHGFERVAFHIPKVPEDITVVERGFGPNNNTEMRLNKNTHLSAIATLHEAWVGDTHERVLALCFYHNSFAEYPFSPNWWANKAILHSGLGPKVPWQFQNWIKLTPDSDAGTELKGLDYGG